ncbi:ABC transporter ATP-binding protein [Acuticoccus sediminis]|nr:ABC transporter ATP-binding protein [Acuticoccus sediminis]
MEEYAVEAVGLSKSYGSVRALKSVDVQIAKGEYFVLLGPSGGGKTTLLRLIGGFLKPTSGDIRINGKSVARLPPNKRPTSMVFQSYALFPHMTVAENIGYGLKIKRIAKHEIDRRVDEMLGVVGLSGFGGRRTFELSGGQQQRVQLARALVLESDIILLDEPLAALDAKLRKDMCFWLKQLQERLGITFIHVTHNQEEAMSVGDRLAIVSGGELVEAGTVRELYETPRKRFTADFIGENNILDGTVAGVADGVARLDLGVATVPVPATEPVVPGTDAALSVRSELMRVSDAAGSGPSLPVTYVERFYLGLVTRHQVRLADGREINVRSVSDRDTTPEIAPGAPAFVTWDVDAGRLHTS